MQGKKQNTKTSQHSKVASKKQIKRLKGSIKAFNELLGKQIIELRKKELKSLNISLETCKTIDTSETQKTCKTSQDTSESSKNLDNSKDLLSSDKS